MTGIPDHLFSAQAKAVAEPLLASFQNMHLINGSYNGEPATFVCAVQQHDGVCKFYPRFIVVTPNMLDHCVISFNRSPKIKSK